MPADESRGLRALRWIAPSGVGASAGALVAGAIEGANGGGGERLIATIGLVCMLALPALLLASLAARGLVSAWKPQVLLEGFREERGGMPRFAAWVAVVWLGTLGLAWAMFQGIWLLVSWTAFKPNSIGFLAPILAVGSVLAVVALSRPCADLFTRIARAIDRRWQRVGPGTLLHPRIVVGAAIVTGLVGVFLIWALLVSRRTNLDWAFPVGPLAAVLVVVVVHGAWSLRFDRGRLVRGVAGGVVGAAAIAAIATAWHLVRARAEITLAIWAEEPIAGVAVDRLFDLEAIRRELPLDAFRPRERTAQHRDLVVITFDGVRADRTPPYGGSAAMPALDDLGKRGTVFRWAFAPSNAAARSIPTLLTGYAPNRVRAKPAPGGAVRLDPRHVMLAERLRAAGYDTAAFTCCADFWHAEARTGWARGLEHVAIDEDNARLGAAARTWVAARTSVKPLFLWIHVRPTHAAGRERAGPAERRTQYDQSLASVDAVLADLIAAFSSRLAEASPIFVVTSAHGEELGEHGQPFKADDLYNTQLHVPFVIAGPGVRARVVHENVSLTDLVPTLLDLGGFHPPRGLDGRSLADVAFGTRRADGAAMIYAAMFSPRGTPSASAVIRNNWKLIDTGSSLELYDIRIDPGEKTNLAGQRTQAVGELRAVLKARLKAGKTAPF